VLNKRRKRPCTTERAVISSSNHHRAQFAQFLSLLIFAGVISLGARGSSNPENPAFPASPLTSSSSGSGELHQPTTINLYPSRDGDRLYVMVTAVGSQSVSMPLAFDTGSAGITPYAPAMSFPSSMFNAGGFIFPTGQTSITYNGITVTNKHGTRSYGGAGGKTETGNAGKESLVAEQGNRRWDANQCNPYVAECAKLGDARCDVTMDNTESLC
jgi:hypothetical protein